MPRTNLSKEELALKRYESQLRAMRRYNEKNKEKILQTSREYYYNKIKGDPEKYKEHLEKKKQYYIKKKQQKQETEEQAN